MYTCAHVRYCYMLPENATKNYVQNTGDSLSLTDATVHDQYEVAVYTRRYIIQVDTSYTHGIVHC